MRSGYFRPRGLLAGFMATTPAPEISELIHLGEQWAPREFYIPTHTHSVWELYLQISGESRWRAEREVYTLKPGGLLAVGPGIEHSMHERSAAKMHFYFAAIDIELALARIPSLRTAWEGRRIGFSAQAEHALAPFRQLIREVSIAQPHQTLGIRLALDSLTLEASRALGVPGDIENLVGVHPAVSRAKQLMDHHPEGNWTLAELSAACDLSPNHLVETFSSDVGTSPRQYLLQRRVERAREMLLETDLPVTEIGLELGFSSGQHFTFRFKQTVGITPSGYRKKGRA